MVNMCVPKNCLSHSFVHSVIEYPTNTTINRQILQNPLKMMLFPGKTSIFLRALLSALLFSALIFSGGCDALKVTIRHRRVIRVWKSGPVGGQQALKFVSPFRNRVIPKKGSSVVLRRIKFTKKVTKF